jgi:ABC-type polysaccharide/polyol phosphate export permease
MERKIFERSGIKRDFQVIQLLVGREITVRYKRSVIGIGWTLVNPIFTSFVLWLLFSNNFGQKLEGGQQYAPYLMAGTLLNVFFTQGVTTSANSILSNAPVLTKIRINPYLYTLSATITGLINFIIGLIPLTLVCIVAGQGIAPTAPLVIVVAFFMVMTISGIGLGLSILFIRFADVASITPVLLTILSYVTPLFYPVSSLNPNMQQIVNLNPLTSFLDCFRWAFSNNSNCSLYDWLYIVITSILAFLLGTLIFKKSWTKVVTML